MALKLKISKEVYEKLSDVLKSEYVEKDGEFSLDVEGGEDTGALKRAKDREAQLRKDAEKKARELEEQLALVSNDDARKKGDIETLEKSWKKKSEETESQYKARIDKLTSYTVKNLIDGTAAQIASKISTVPSLMAKALKERLSVDFENDEPVLRVLDSAGKPSGLSLEDLTKEFVANKEFAGIIVGSKSTGGGAAKDGFTKSGGATTQTDKEQLLSKMNPSELAAILKARKEQKGD